LKQASAGLRTAFLFAQTGKDPQHEPLFWMVQSLSTAQLYLGSGARVGVVVGAGAAALFVWLVSRTCYARVEICN
jgi:hypothetical protein